jgi:hypothetical protein
MLLTPAVTSVQFALRSAFTWLGVRVGRFWTNNAQIPAT